MVTHCKIIPPSSSGIAQSASNTIVQNKVNQRISEQNGKFIILHGIKKKNQSFLSKIYHVKYCASMWNREEVDSASLAFISSSICAPPCFDGALLITG